MSARGKGGRESRKIRLEAARWVLRLEDRESDPGEMRADGDGSDEAFLDWLGKSPMHVRAFFELYETDRRVRAAATAGRRTQRQGSRPRGRSRHRA